VGPGGHKGPNHAGPRSAAMPFTVERGLAKEAPRWTGNSAERNTATPSPKLAPLTFRLARHQSCCQDLGRVEFLDTRCSYVAATVLAFPVVVGSLHPRKQG
jgi:hypothetical protein